MVEPLLSPVPGGLDRFSARHALGELLRLGGVAALRGGGLGYGAQAAVVIRPAVVTEIRVLGLRLVGEPPGALPWPRRLLALHAPAVPEPPGEPLYVDDGGRVWITLDDGVVRCHADPVATADYLLAQREELESPGRRDAHGRLARSLSATPDVAFDGPWLERWGRFLAAALSLEGVVALVDRHPGGADWSIVPTHDVDSLAERGLGRGLRLLGAGVLKLSGERLREGRRMLGLLPRPDRHRRLEHCAAADSPDRGTYFFHPGPRGPFDPDYNLRRHRAVLERLLADGQEIGHHYGYLCAGDPGRLRGEVEELRRLTGLDGFGGRAHYLRLRHPAELSQLEEAGLEYDASLGFSDAPGWRLATGGPYRPRHHAEERALRLFELPLPLMDGALFRAYGDGPVDVEDAWERTLPFLEAARDAGACLSLLWHQRVFGPAYPGWGEVYGRAVHWARTHGAGVAPAREIISLALDAERLRAHDGRLVNEAGRPLTLRLSTDPGRCRSLGPGESLEMDREP